jgi:hypothetical protein
METEINIVEILKDKPQGTKLYSSACGKCKLEEVDDKSFKISFYNSKFGFMNGGEGYLDKNGKLYDDGECVVFPSKEMRNWSKFAWKKGDVLVGVGQRIIFEKFIDENYTRFQGKYSLSTYEDKTLVADKRCYTSYFRKLDDSGNVENYFKKLEEELGGKLNRETLEVEKVQPEFKDGDIVCISGMGYLVYGIVKSIDYSSKKLEYYVLNDMSTLKFEDWLSFEDKQIQPITETQQIILFDALLKENKRWDAEKKMIVDLKPKVEFKPFDKVLCRNSKDDTWEADFFARLTRKEIDYTQSDKYLCVGDLWMYCIPYNDSTKHLLGTTDEWKGGEG